MHTGVMIMLNSLHSVTTPSLVVSSEIMKYVENTLIVISSAQFKMFGAPSCTSRSMGGCTILEKKPMNTKT